MEHIDAYNPESLEQFHSESLETTDKISLSESARAVINDYVDLNGQAPDIVETYDKEIKSFLPNLPTAIHLSLMEGYDDKWTKFLDKIDSHFLESISDKEQVEAVAQYMAGIEEIQFDKWKHLTSDQMVAVLDSMETEIAKIEHRLPANISAEYLGEDCFGQQCGRDIKINTHILEESSRNPEMFREVLTTFIHEGRHMYQDYNINVRLVHESPSEVNSWRENLYELGYRSGAPIEIPLIGPISYTNDQLMADGERLYYYQPVETDARDYSSDVMIRYEEILSGCSNDMEVSSGVVTERLSGINERINVHRNLLPNDVSSHGEISFKGMNINDKAWNEKKAQENLDWAEWYTKKAEDAIEKGDMTKANDYLKRAQLAEDRAEDYLKAAEKCTK